MTYTCAELEISTHAFEEIAGKLSAAGYHHAFDPNRDFIDMSGIAVSPTEPKAGSMVFQPSYRCFDYDICKWGIDEDWSVYKNELSTLVGTYATASEAMVAAEQDRTRTESERAIYQAIYNHAMGEYADLWDTSDLTDEEWGRYCDVQEEANRRVDLAHAEVDAGRDWEALATAEGWLPANPSPANSANSSEAQAI